MEQLYRIHPDARKFYPLGTHSKCLNLETWNKNNVPKEILQKVEKMYVEEGHVSPVVPYMTDISELKGKDKIAKLYFTIVINDCTPNQYDHLNGNRSKIMDAFQSILNEKFKL